MPASVSVMAVALQTPQDTASDYATLAFVIQQILSGVATATLVKIIACTNTGGLERAGRVDVRILVGQVTGDGQVIKHGVTYNLPYFRIQGGANAVILDPQPGDIGLAVFCMRDISAVKKDPALAVSNDVTPPGSARQYSFSDGIYFGGMMNAAPTQYVQFEAGGISVVSTTKVTIQAPEIELDGTVTTTSSVTAQGDVIGQGISLHDHVHSGVQSGGSNTDPPVP